LEANKQKINRERKKCANTAAYHVLAITKKIYTGRGMVERVGDDGGGIARWNEREGRRNRKKREREREEGEVQTSTCMTKKREGLVVNNTKKRKPNKGRMADHLFPRKKKKGCVLSTKGKKRVLSRSGKNE